jgi:hypothetical protein
MPPSSLGALLCPVHLAIAWFKGSDLMALTVPCIENLSERNGGQADGSLYRRLSENQYWHLVGSPFQSCKHRMEQDSCWNDAEFLGQILQEIKDRQTSRRASRQATEKQADSFVNRAFVFGGQAKLKAFFTFGRSAATSTVSMPIWPSQVSWSRLFTLRTVFHNSKTTYGKWQDHFCGRSQHVDQTTNCPIYAFGRPSFSEADLS